MNQKHNYGYVQNATKTTSRDVKNLIQHALKMHTKQHTSDFTRTKQTATQLQTERQRINTLKLTKQEQLQITKLQQKRTRKELTQAEKEYNSTFWARINLTPQIARNRWKCNIPECAEIKETRTEIRHHVARIHKIKYQTPTKQTTAHTAKMLYVHRLAIHTHRTKIRKTISMESNKMPAIA